MTQILNETLQWVTLGFVTLLTVAIARVVQKSPSSSLGSQPALVEIEPGAVLPEFDLGRASDSSAWQVPRGSDNFTLIFVSSSCPACEHLLQDISSRASSEQLQEVAHSVAIVHLDRTIDNVPEKLRLLSCYDRGEAAGRSLGRTLGIRGTPSFIEFRRDNREVVTVGHPTQSNALSHLLNA